MAGSVVWDKLGAGRKFMPTRPFFLPPREPKSTTVRLGFNGPQWSVFSSKQKLEAVAKLYKYKDVSLCAAVCGLRKACQRPQKDQTMAHTSLMHMHPKQAKLSWRSTYGSTNRNRKWTLFRMCIQEDFLLLAWLTYFRERLINENEYILASLTIKRQHRKTLDMDVKEINANSRHMTDIFFRRSKYISHICCWI